MGKVAKQVKKDDIITNNINNTNNANKYQKLDQREHVLKRPNMYIGNIDPDIIETYVYNESKSIIEKREIEYIAGLYKIFDEIIVNALDHVIRLQTEQIQQDEATNVIEKHKIFQTKTIKVNIDRSNGEICVYNDGNGIDIYKDTKHDIYIPEMIF